MLWEVSIVSRLSRYSILVQHACNDRTWLTSSNLITFQYSFIQNQKSCTVLENIIILYWCLFLLIKGALILIYLYQKFLHCTYSTSHGHCSITRVFHAWKSAILHANSTRMLCYVMLCYVNMYVTQVNPVSCGLGLVSRRLLR